jgi:hypothetical protein
MPELKLNSDPLKGNCFSATRAKGQGQKKKQIPHPSALCAYGLRMTAEGNGQDNGRGNSRSNSTGNGN